MITRVIGIIFIFAYGLLSWYAEDNTMATIAFCLFLASIIASFVEYIQLKKREDFLKTLQAQKDLIKAQSPVIANGKLFYPDSNVVTYQAKMGFGLFDIVMPTNYLDDRLDNKGIKNLCLIITFSTGWFSIYGFFSLLGDIMQNIKEEKTTIKNLVIPNYYFDSEKKSLETIQKIESVRINT